MSNPTAPRSSVNFNPCQLPNADEHIPAKLWELLRRNTSFKKKVGELLKLDVAARSSDSNETPSRARQRAQQLVARISKTHPFADIALEWLVPDPLFLAEREGPAGVEAGEGLTPDLADKSWRWSPTTQPNTAGHRSRRGPHVCRFLDDRDTFADWKNWHAGAQLFDLETPWDKTPLGFQREFAFVWRSRFDYRPVNPATKNRSDSPVPQEIDGPLLEAAFAAGETAKVLPPKIMPRQFLQQPEAYRVFAIPRTILTKGTADTLGKWLKNSLRKGSAVSPPAGTKKITELHRDLLPRLLAWNKRKGIPVGVAETIQLRELAQDYRLFFVPRLRRKKLAQGREFAALLKKGAPDYGKLVAKGLLNEKELIGTETDWDVWLRMEAKLARTESSVKRARKEAIHEKYGFGYGGVSNSAREGQPLVRGVRRGDNINVAMINHSTHFGIRWNHIETLRDAVFPQFDLNQIFPPVPFRSA